MVNKIILLLFCISLLGCSTKYVEKPVEVKTPVIIQIYKPERPIYSKNDNTISYLIKIIEYTKILETSIEKHNKLLNN